MACGGEGVTELMQGLGAGQGQRKADQPASTQVVDETGLKDIPLAGRQEQAAQAEEEQYQRGAGVIQPRQAGGDAREPFLGVGEGKAEEEVVSRVR